MVAAVVVDVESDEIDGGVDWGGGWWRGWIGAVAAGRLVGNSSLIDHFLPSVRHCPEPVGHAGAVAVVVPSTPHPHFVVAAVAAGQSATRQVPYDLYYPLSRIPTDFAVVVDLVRPELDCADYVVANDVVDYDGVAAVVVDCCSDGCGLILGQSLRRLGMNGGSLVAVVALIKWRRYVAEG